VFAWCTFAVNLWCTFAVNYWCSIRHKVTRPSVWLQDQLTQLLEHGHLTELPADVVATLRRRREQESGRGHWTEGHYRPGLRLRVEPTKPDHG